MKRNWYFFILLVPLLILLFLNAGAVKDKPFTQTLELTRIRNIGHLVLKSVGDSVSRVLPVEKTGDAYKLIFERPFSPNSDSLLRIAMQQLSGRGAYALELWQKDSNKLVYSFVVANTAEQTVLPCLQRPLPPNNYEIVIRFAEGDKRNYLLAGSLLLLLLAAGWIVYKKRPAKTQAMDEPDLPFISISTIKFYPDKQKLVLGNIVTELTVKENQVLTLLAQTPNEVVERSKLQKEIWEDQGVIVARSLDIFISRLRKKLSIDPAVKIVNLHGKGYRLEIV